MAKKLNILPPLSVMAQWRQGGLSPAEIYQKSADFTSRLDRPQETGCQGRSPNPGMIALYREGRSLRETALAFGVSHECVRQNLLRAGVAIRPAHYPGRKITPPDNLAEIVQTIGKKAACQEFGISLSTLYAHLRCQGVTLRRSIGCPRCQAEPYARHLCKACYQLWLRRGKPALA